MNVAHNPTIRKELITRWNKLGLKMTDVVKDSNERFKGSKITPESISRWKNNVIVKGKRHWISEQQAHWLCERWGIRINLNFGKPSLTTEGKLQWKIEPYSEIDCIKRLKEIFIITKVKNKKK